MNRKVKFIQSAKNGVTGALSTTKINPLKCNCKSILNLEIALENLAGLSRKAP